jgi:cell wall-associated NlpC family hydrolase
MKFYPTENQAFDKLNDFVIDPKDYRDINAECDVVGIVHSHPHGDLEPSPLDRAACDRLGIPWYIFNTEEYIKLESKNEILPLIGRPFVFGAYDCYTIIKDYFDTIGIHIREYQYEWEFWERGQNLYVEHYEKEGFKKVTDGSLKPNDVILMALNSEVTNHAGVYMGNFKMLHHAPSRLSCRDNYNGIWRNITRMVVRHESMI